MNARQISFAARSSSIFFQLAGHPDIYRKLGGPRVYLLATSVCHTALRSQPYGPYSDDRPPDRPTEGPTVMVDGKVTPAGNGARVTRPAA